MRQSEFHIAADDRKFIESYRTKGLHHAGKSIERILCQRLISVSRKRKSWPFWSLDEPLSGEHGPRTWRAVRSAPCAMSNVPASHVSTTTASIQRFLPWRAQRQRWVPSPGR